MPHTKGCDEDGPEFPCWMDVANPEVTFPTYSVDVKNVRFRRDQVRDDRGWTIAIVIFGIREYTHVETIVPGQGKGVFLCGSCGL